MNEMERMEEYDYRDGRGGNYRDDYRRDYRYDYRDEYGRNQRDRRNYRDYRDYRDYRGYRDRRNYRSQEDYTMMLEDTIDDSMELSRTYEDLSEMTNNNAEKQKLMKMAEREKEHYRTVKEIMQNRM